MVTCKRDLLAMSSDKVSSTVKAENMLIGALLRIPAQAIQRRIIKQLNAAGFDELRVPHMAVLQFPGPDGVRPSTLAERAGISKQAMNQLLRSLERLGYIVRSDVPHQGRARLVRFTQRGKAAYSKVHDILCDIERGWSTELGPERFAQLKELLLRVWESPLINGISNSCEKRRQVQKSLHHRNTSPTWATERRPPSDPYTGQRK